MANYSVVQGLDKMKSYGDTFAYISAWIWNFYDRLRSFENSHDYVNNIKDICMETIPKHNNVHAFNRHLH